MTRLENELSPGVLVKRVDEPTFAHLDFTWSPDAATAIYPQILDLLKKYSNKEYSV